MSVASGVHNLLRSRTLRLGSLALLFGLALLDGWWRWSASQARNSSTSVTSTRAPARMSMQELYDCLVAGETQPVHDRIACLREELPEDNLDWNYCNVAHKLMTLIGLLALFEEDDVNGAKDFLIMSSQMRGSPQLNSFGPNMLLAKALLERGEFETVEIYLEHCRTFWERGTSTLDTWIREVHDHRIPDFGANIEY